MSEELPWERACSADPRYAAWSSWVEVGGPTPRGPWRKLCSAALSLLRRALAPDPSRRASLSSLLELPWSREPAGECRPTSPQPAARRPARGRVRY